MYVRGIDNSEIHHFVEKVIFYLHESFPKPKRGKLIGKAEASQCMVWIQWTILFAAIQFILLITCCLLLVIKEPPYQLNESGYASFEIPIEVYFRNREEPKKISLEYDLFIDLGRPVTKLKREKLTFLNPSADFKKKLLKGGAVSALFISCFIWAKF